MTQWSLTTIRRLDGSTSAAIRRADGSHVVPDALRGYPGLREALEDWGDLRHGLATLDPDTLDPVEATESLSIVHPRKVLCVGANYRDHLAEMGDASVPRGIQPYFFSVPPTTALVGDGADILVPEDPTLNVDWEAELAIVIGTGGRDIDEADALDYVAGFACFNDITARSLMRRKTAIAPPFTWDWLGSKGLDTFCPIGAVTPSWLVPDPGDLRISCFVNGVAKQQGRTSDLIIGIAALVAAASRSSTLEPGDVIATGTPAGVGNARGERLVAGDEVRVEIEGLAPLTNRVRTRPAGAQAVDRTLAQQNSH